uniref:Uncharacterized protein n=1 Tax=Anguilla anguilla TaxID=7936 RepID=A0A0E9WX41_ANGAN
MSSLASIITGRLLLLLNYCKTFHKGTEEQSFSCHLKAKNVSSVQTS